MAIENVQFRSDQFTVRSALARPEGASPAKAVIILHEWWGLNDNIKSLVQRFAKEGYAALAPDLYARQGENKVTTSPQEAAKWMTALSTQGALRDINAAIGYLKAQTFVDPSYGVGLVGLSMGGTLGLIQAGHNSDIRAAAIFYGKTPPVESIRYLLCPILFHHDGKDDWVTTAEVNPFKEGLQKLGKPAEVVVYPEAGHGFFNDSRPEAYRPLEAKGAWDRTLRFLSQHLK